MRPYPDELLAVMRRSLETVVTPNVGDDWARYVAKSLERLLEHLERRWRLELRLLADDTEELRELFAKLGTDLEGRRPGTHVEPAIEAMENLLVEPSLASRAVEFSSLNQENEAHRAALEALVTALDDVDADPVAEGARLRIRAYLRRQLDRDVQLAEPTFMHFGPRPESRS